MIRTQYRRAGLPITAAIRPACAADMGALSDFFAGLSLQSRYLRFFAPVTPGPELLRRMSGGDGHTDAVIAVREGVIIGHAMAADQAGPRSARTADIGVVVADAWQGLGVASALMSALITAARARGVTSLTMDVLPGNRAMLAMIASHWPAARIEDSADFLTFSIPLPRHRHQRPQPQPAAPQGSVHASSPCTPFIRDLCHDLDEQRSVDACRGFLQPVGAYSDRMGTVPHRDPERDCTRND